MQVPAAVPTLATAGPDAPPGALAEALARQRAAYVADPVAAWPQRAGRLVRLQALLREEGEALATALDADYGGRSRVETANYELFPARKAVRHALRHGRRWMRPRRPWADWWALPGRCELRPQPLGVVGVVAPWNYPLLLTVGPLIDALVAGNRVMLKLPEQVPQFSAALAAAVARRFAPDEVLAVQGGPDVAAAFSALAFDHLLFTGSTAVGRRVMAAASAHLTPVTLELGGKSPAIVLADADLPQAVHRLLSGKFVNAGQTCIAPDTVLVDLRLRDAFVAEAQRQAHTLWPDPARHAEHTRVLNLAQWLRLQAWQDEAEAAGARAVPLGAPSTTPLPERLMRPTLLLDAPDHTRVMQEEVFGPLLPVVAVDGLEGAIAWVNARPRPLALYLFTASAAAREAVLTRTHSGGVTVGDTLLHIGQENLPFGGIGASGLGAYHGEAGFRTFSHFKPVFHQSRWALTRHVGPPHGPLSGWLAALVMRLGG
ncbi:aldehyde dehydrogenase family protein [Ideonella livida]|uniref:Aldehyde dehydrogenase n=1 Tax=Ideonella livida TaxID=2707176 RepID=A0A7C9TNS4_9BURK|nr:aldehyde dehydrogenase family protein [Ideonella livida]NDY93567.1 aldehyde dehydrogenase family protein [Ideonella livida]